MPIKLIPSNETTKRQREFKVGDLVRVSDTVGVVIWQSPTHAPAHFGAQTLRVVVLVSGTSGYKSGDSLDLYALGGVEYIEEPLTIQNVSE